MRTVTGQENMKCSQQKDEESMDESMDESLSPELTTYTYDRSHQKWR
jgi:hypothetical protein